MCLPLFIKRGERNYGTNFYSGTTFFVSVHHRKLPAGQRQQRQPYPPLLKRLMKSLRKMKRLQGRYIQVFEKSTSKMIERWLPSFASSPKIATLGSRNRCSQFPFARQQVCHFEFSRQLSGQNLCNFGECSLIPFFSFLVFFELFEQCWMWLLLLHWAG